MRILFVTHMFAPAIGGSEQYMTDLAEELVIRGHAVDVVTSQTTEVATLRNCLPPFTQHKGIHIHRFRTIPRFRWTWHLLRYANQAHDHYRNKVLELIIACCNGFIMPGMAQFMIRNARNYDLVHIQTLPFAHTLYSYLCARYAGKPIVLTPHLHVDDSQAFDLELFNYLLRRVDLVFAHTERELSYLIERGVAPRNITIDGVGVRLDTLPQLDPSECRLRLGLPIDAYIVLFLGRKAEYKGLGSLVQALASLRSLYPSAMLVSAGPRTSYSTALQDAIQSQVNWVDFDTVTDSQKIDLLNACDVLTLPSIGESFGIVLLEAWAVGKPVIGARAGALPWIINEGQNGLLVNPGQHEELSQAISRLIEDPQLAIQLGNAGRTKVFERFTVERVTDTIETAYQRILGGISTRATEADVSLHR